MQFSRTQCFTMWLIQQIPILLIIIYGCIDSGYTQTDCGPDKFRCRNGQCIANELLCDGKADCLDSSDETKDECKKPGILCPPYAFSCDYGACINGDKMCNGEQDCVDNSDETHCTNNSTEISNCEEDQYKCDNGQCILNINVCDGTRNCRDGSDETSLLCSSLHCPAIAFRCNYGACIDGDLQCNRVANCADNSDEDPNLCKRWPPRRPTGTTTPSRPSPIPSTNTCKAPPQPENGHWKLHQLQCSNERDCNVPEGTELEKGSYLIYSCNSGYKLTGFSDIICDFQGQWPIIPNCTEIHCKPLISKSVSAKCKLNTKQISCESPVPPQTDAELTCKNKYRPEIDPNLLSTRRNNVRCNENGQWEPEPMKCIPECGTLPFLTDSTPTVVSGFRANITEFPWYATLYLDEAGLKTFHCGASIIKDNLLITAAHCVYDDTYQQFQNTTIYILTGNIFREYDNPNHNLIPNLVQRNQVKRIYIDRNYLGAQGNYFWDIAILELVRPFKFSAWLVPICIDISNNKNLLEIEEVGSFGRVAGFGRTEAGEPSAILQALKLPVISRTQCRSESQSLKTQKFITNDKFCAGYTNGTSVCDGDSGSGLVFEGTNNLWYLRGIVSLSLGVTYEGGTRHCNPYTYSLYTDVARYILWIEDVIFKIEHNQIHLLCSELSSTKCS